MNAFDARRQAQIDACRKKAVAILEASPLGLEAIQGGFWTDAFNWLYRELDRGRTPTGIPAKLLGQWRAMGEFRNRKKGIRA